MVFAGSSDGTPVGGLEPGLSPSRAQAPTPWGISTLVPGRRGFPLSAVGRMNHKQFARFSREGGIQAAAAGAAGGAGRGARGPGDTERETRQVRSEAASPEPERSARLLQPGEAGERGPGSESLPAPGGASGQRSPRAETHPPLPPPQEGPDGRLLRGHNPYGKVLALN